jgi:hypothetical protein
MDGSCTLGGERKRAMIRHVGAGGTWWEGVHILDHSFAFRYWVQVQSGHWTRMAESSRWFKMHRGPNQLIEGTDGVAYEPITQGEVYQELMQYAWQLNDPLSWRKGAMGLMADLGAGKP